MKVQLVDQVWLIKINRFQGNKMLVPNSKYTKSDNSSSDCAFN